MANILTVPESGIYFDGNTAGSSAVPTLTGDASGVAIQYDGYAGITISSSATGVDYQDRFSIEGENGRLFGVSDQVVGSVFSVNDAGGLPLIDVEVEQDFSKITLGQYGTDAIVISGSSVQVTGSNVVTEGYLSDQEYITSSDETYSTASELLTAIKTVDGANSNLDADKLDGQQGSYYLNYNNFSNTPTIPSAANNTTITLSGGTEITTTIGDFTTNQSSPETLTINHSDVSRTNTTSNASPAFGATFTVVDGVTSNARGHVTAQNVKTITLPSLGTTSTTALAGNTTVNDVSEANLKSRLAALDSNDTIYIGDAGDDTTVVIRGTLQVDGSTTTVNSTTITVDDKNIELGSIASPSDSLADGGGITLKGTTDKTITWIDSTDSWTSNQNFSAPSLTLTSLSNQSSEATALVVNGSNVVGFRELGSNAFNSTSYLPLAGGTMTGVLTLSQNNNLPLRITGSNSNYIAMLIANTGSGNAGVYYDAINGDLAGSDYGFIGQEDAGYMLYDIGASSPAPYHVFTGGNVGIGTTSPDQKLQVIGDVSVGKYDGTDFDRRIGINSSNGGYANGSSYIRFQELSASGTTNTTKGCNIRFYNHLYAGNTNETLVIQANGNVGIGTTSPDHKLEIGLTSTVALANQPAEPLHVSNNGQNVDGRVFISVKHDAVNTASAVGAGFKMTAAAVTSGTASYDDSLIFLKSAGSSNVTVHSAPRNIQFYVDNHDTNAGSGANYNDLGDLALTIGEDTNATFAGSVTATSLIKSGGSSSEFLKADGSVDSNTYLTSLGTAIVDGDFTANGLMKRTGNGTYTSITDNSSNWDTAYTDRNKWDGGSTGLTASTGRTSLGLGSAATSDSSEFATAAQGTSAETAYGWGDHASAGYITAVSKKISGDGSATTFTVTHNFGTPLVMTQLLDYGDNGTGATYEVVQACIQRSSDNAIDVLFGSAPSSSEDYLVLMTKMPAIS